MWTMPFLVLASDGLWDEVSAKDVSKMLTKKKIDLEKTCQMMIKKAISRGSEDNICVLIVDLRRDVISECKSSSKQRNNNIASNPVPLKRKTSIKKSGSSSRKKLRR